MPRVPEGPLSTGRTAPVANVVQRLDARGIGTQEAAALGDVAQGLGRVASEFRRRANELQDQEDSSSAMLAFSQFSDELRDYEFGENGILNRRGGDANGISEAASKDLSSFARRARDGLSENAQRAFDALAFRRRETSLNSAARHEASEMDAFRTEASVAMVKGAIEDAVAGFNEPDRIDAALLQAQTAILANSQGKSGEVVQQQLEDARSAIHEGVINRMTLANPSAAKQYFETNKDQIDGDSQARIDQTLKTALPDFEASAIAGVVYDPEASLTDMREQVQAETQNPDVIQEAMRQINLTRAEQNRDKTVAQNAAYNALFLLIDNGGTTVVDAKKTPEWQALTPAMRQTLKAVETAKLRPGLEIESNIRLAELSELSAADPQGFAALNLNLDAATLSRTDLRDLTTLQGRIRRGDHLAITGAQTDTQIIIAAMRGIGVGTGANADDAEIASKARFTRRYLDEIAAFTERNDREPDDRERLQISDNLTMRVTDEGFFRDTQIPIFELEVGNLTPDDIEDVAAVFAAQGIDMTVENFEEFVRAAVKDGTLPPSALGDIDLGEPATQARTRGFLN